MLNIHILSLFPELFDNFTRLTLVGKSIKEGLLDIQTVHLRDFAINAQGQVDDTPYGGGSGMILRMEPAVAAIEKIKNTHPNSKVILPTPRGAVFNQEMARALAEDYQKNGVGYIFLCSRYEGVDERIAENYADLEVSLGDFVLMGGEAAAMCMLEAILRLIPGAIGNPDSLKSESFENHLLEHPQYTKPREFRSSIVPDILLSGNHEQIRKWRHQKAIEDTVERRPELIDGIEKITCDLSIALIHYPVLDKNGQVVTSSITNIDVHDIARTARTFDLKNFYIVHPVKTLRLLAARICEHWESGYGATYNPNRREALSVVKLVCDFDDVLLDIESKTGALPKVVSTSAKPGEKITSFASMRAILRTTEETHLIILGTGWGLTDEMHSRAHYQLEPIAGYSDYNHLSVRAAASIIVDRLLRPLD